MANAFLHIANGTASFMIALLSFWALYYYYKKQHYITGTLLWILGTAYGAFGTLSVLWAAEIVQFSFSDFYLIRALIGALLSFFLTLLIYLESKNKSLLWLTALYLIGLVLVTVISYHPFFIEILSYVFILILFWNLRRLITNSVLWYGIGSMVLVLVSFFSPTLSLFWFVPALFIAFTFKDLVDYKKENRAKIASKDSTKLSMGTVKAVIFTLGINVFLIFGTVALHELGHSMAADYYGCNYYSILSLNEFSPHTLIDCNETSYNFAIMALSGPLLTIAAALLLFFTSDKHVNASYNGYLIMGFALLVSYGDLSSLNVTENTMIVVYLFAIALIISGLNKAVKSLMHNINHVS